MSAPEVCWLAVQFPHLALDLLTRGSAPQQALPIAVSDGAARQARVLDCNPAAVRLGVQAGQLVSAATGLAESLCLSQRDPRAEAEALERLAACCYRYSGWVSVRPQTATILLEAGASQRLYGPPVELARRIERELLRWGYHAQVGGAPTPAAAQVAAGLGACVAPVDLRAWLDALPLTRLHLEPGQCAALERMGWRRLGEVLRLPRKALVRRLGPALADYLDRLSGVQAEPLPGWQPPESFATQLELPAEIATSQALLFPLKRLLAELCASLRARDRGVQEVQIRLLLRRGVEELRVGLCQPGRDEAQLLVLLRERLARLRLPQPVRRIELAAPQLFAFAAGQGTLLDEPASTGVLDSLLERLRARLGPEAVTGLRAVADHRPERSWAARAPGAADVASTALPHRPVWLFPEPRRCHIDDYRVLAGPERIESGWWDGHDCRRDYFIVRDDQGSTLWAYREYKPNPGWFLHGLFG